MKIGGKEVDPEKTYTLASINYLLEEGGDGNIFFGKCDILQTCPAPRVSVKRYENIP